MLQTARKNKVTVKLVLLTHAHPDHIADLARLRNETDAPVFTPEDEPAPGATPFEEGKYWQVGNLHVDTRKTWGHSPGGMTYVVNGLSRKLAIVGDAIFAGSMGGGNVSYRDALQTNIDKILTLPDETVICPGHGPLTTVGEEKQHNPFFAGIIDP
jgi:glyoxylase-like metal-dependent hydrolase (beta-lactamase superfamily II)